MEKQYRIGFTTGVFDMFHIGHLNLLERCKKMCSYLIVGVCDDEYVRVIKRKEPVVAQENRARIISALKCVDEVVLIGIDDVEDKMIPLNAYHFNVLFSGDDWKGSERYKKTEQQFKEYNVAIEYLPYTKGVSTTQLREKLKSQD